MKQHFTLKLILFLLIANITACWAEGIGPALNIPMTGGGVVNKSTFFAYKTAGEQIFWDIKIVSGVTDTGTPVDWVIRVYSPSGILVGQRTFLSTNPIGTSFISNTTSNEVGIFTFELVPGSNFTNIQKLSVDINVATNSTGTTRIPGRVYTNQINFRSGGADVMNFSLYSVNKQGYKYTTRFNGLKPFYMTYSVNPFGNTFNGTCVSAYKSYSTNIGENRYQDGRSCGTPSKLFFNTIATSIPATANRFDIATGTTVTEWLNAPITTASVNGLLFNPTAASGPGAATGNFTFNTVNYEGSAKLYVDVNNNGNYTDAEDRVFPVSITQDAHTVAFDGKNGLGQDITCQTLRAKVVLEKPGETHFVLNDVEGMNGIQITRTNGSGAPSSLINWDDREVSTAGKLSVANPLVGTNVNSTTTTHGWGQNDANGWGDNAMIDHWAYSPVQVASSEIVYNINNCKEFVCDSYLYQTQTLTSPSLGRLITYLYRYNPATGSRDTLGSMPGQVNAIAYNSLDNFIYGYDYTNDKVVRIDQNAQIMSYTIPNLPNTVESAPGDPVVIVKPYINGEIINGYLYLYAKEAGTRVFVVDVNSNRATYMQLVDPSLGYILDAAPYGTLLSTPIGISDWVYSPTTGKIYAIHDKNTASGNDITRYLKLITIDPITMAVTFSNGPVVGGGFEESTNIGATFIDAAGLMYVFSNVNGRYYRIDPTTNTATLLSTSTPNNANDGASCPFVAPFRVDLGDAPDSYGTLLNSKGPSHILSEDLKIGSLVDFELDGIPSIDALGDDNDESDDEDGIASFATLKEDNTQYEVSVAVTNTTGQPATLSGWIDFNIDGKFTNNERAQIVVPNGATSAILSWTGLSGLVKGDSYLRLRLATDASEVDNPSGDAGSAVNGEVEDYTIVIETALPVKLINFNATKENSVVNLKWQTSEETRSDYFEVQRSKDGIIWNNLTKISSNGESTSIKDYDFTDKSPVGGQNIYRLKMVDIDQTFSYSRLVSISMEGYSPLVIFPNPSSEYVMVDVQGKDVKKIKVMNLIGKVVYQTRLANKIDVNKFPEGLYIISVEFEDGEVQSDKFVITR
jgi:hypothetical protein